MKKKKALIITVAAIVLLALITPVRMSLKDGGSVRYKAVLYEITKIHQLNIEGSAKPYTDGYEIKILGMRVYRKTDEEPRKSNYKSDADKKAKKELNLNHKLNADLTENQSERAEKPTANPKNETTNPTPTKKRKKELKLNHKLKVDLTENQKRESRNTDIDLRFHDELDWTPVSSLNGKLNGVIDYIAKDYPSVKGEKWLCNVHFFDADKTVGIIQFRYIISDTIITNKGIVCTVENNKITELCYTNMDGSVDEQSVIDKKKNFEDEYTQKKRELKDNEEFIREDVSYTYNYNLGKLIYTYNLFYYETVDDLKVINNSTVSEYFVN